MLPIKWSLKPPEPVLERELARACGLSPVTARLLVNRGVLTPREAAIFFEGTLADLHAPDDMRDLPALTAAISQATAAGEKILVYGDYDVDGMTATAILVKAIRLLGGDAVYYIPRRSEGYGVHEEPLRRAAADGVRLTVTVDCGVTARDAVSFAAARGIRLLVTDHHRPQGALPETLVVNPRRADCSYPFKELAGAGVALKVAQSLLGPRFAEHAPEFFGLACLGTIADVVPLTGENRLLVRFGLPGVRRNAGLDALAAAIRLPADPSVRDVAYLLAPHLNAAGRLDDARLGVELLLTGDPGERSHLVDELLRLNQARQDLEGRMMAEILATVSGWDSPPPAAVFAGEGWHPGVTGVVASRMAERLDRPVLVIAVEGDVARGSARSGPDCDVFHALQACEAYLTEFGGHRCAAGFELRRGNLEAFTAAFGAAIAAAGTQPPALEIDAVVNLNDLSLGVVEEIARLAPWGHGNPEPLLAVMDAEMVEARPVGCDRAHLKVVVRQASTTLVGIAFRRGQDAESLPAGRRVDLAFTPIINEWRGRRSAELRVADWRPKQAGSMTGLSRPRPFLKDLFREAIALVEKETPPTLLPACLADEGREADSPATADEPLPDRLVDRRDRAGRDVWLAGLLLDGTPTLVVVRTPRRAPLVAAALYRRASLLEERVAYLHPGLSPDYREAVDSLWRAGELNGLVLAAEDLPLAGKAPRIVVYDLPYDWTAWRLVSRRARDLLLAFKAEDRSANRRLLRTLAPGRTSIGALYALLRQAGVGDNYHLLNTETLAATLASRLGLPVAPWTVSIALLVLADLGLVEYHKDDEGRLAVRVLPPNGKRGLAHSATFRRAHGVKRLSLARQRRFIEAATEEIAAALEFDDDEWMS